MNEPAEQQLELDRVEPKGRALVNEIKKVADSKQQTAPETTRDKVQIDLDKLKAVNDAYEAEELRAEELRARRAVGGRADAGQPEKSQQELADEEAKEILKPFQSE